MTGEWGPIEGALRVELLHLDAPNRVLSAMALNLARTLDDGAGLAVAAVNRELRETVKMLMPAAGGEDDRDARTRELLARLSSPLGDAKN